MKLKKYWLTMLVWTMAVWPVLMVSGAEQEVKLPQEEVVRLAKYDPEMLLRKSVENFAATVGDYTGVLYKQESIKGKLGKEQAVEFKFREKPYSIFMEWKMNAGKIDKLLYVEGQNKNKMLLHPTGLLSFIKSVEKYPNDKEVMKSSRKPCTEFGLLKVMRGLLSEYENDRGKSKIRTEFVNEFEENNHKYVLLEQTFVDPANDGSAKRVITYDVGLMLPAQRKAYDSEGRLLYRYTYEDLKFNVELQDKDFDAEVNGL